MEVPFFPFKAVRDGDGGMAVQSPYTAKPVGINPSASALLSLCDGSQSIDEIVDALCDRFESSPESVRPAVHRFLRDYEARGLVWIRGERMRWFDAAPPESIFWEVTAKCNLRCRHCVVSAGAEVPGELSTQEGLDLLSQWAHMGVRDVTFSGGEPLLRSDIHILLRTAAALGLSVGFSTNGTCLTPQAARELRALGANVQVSLDGSCAEVYARLRGSRSAFDLALRGIRTLVSAGNDITIGTVLTKHNLDDIPAMLRLVERLGVNRFRLIPFIAYGRGQESMELEPLPNEVKEVTAYLHGERGKRPLDIVSLEFEETFRPPPPGPVDPQELGGCSGAISYCTVTPAGEVLPCHYFEGVRAESVRDLPFAEIWRSSRFLNYFRSLRINDIRGPCRHCEWLPKCRGSCRAANFSHARLLDSNRHCWLVAEAERGDTG